MRRLHRNLVAILSVAAFVTSGGCCHFLGIGCNDCKPCGCRTRGEKCHHHPPADATEHLSIDAPAPELIPLPTRPVFGPRMSGLQAGMHEMLQPTNVDQFVPSTAGAPERRAKPRTPSVPRSKLVTTARFIESAPTPTSTPALAPAR